MVKKDMTKSNEKMKSLRQMVQEKPAEFNALIRVMDLPSSSIITVITTTIANLLQNAPSDKEIEEFFKLLKKDSHEKLEMFRKLKTEFKIEGRREVCVVCEKKFLSDNSGEVPVCMPCLLGYTPQSESGKP